MTSPHNRKVKTIVYVCEHIKPESGGYVDGLIKKFNGFPLGFEIIADTDKVKIMASEVSTKLPKKSDFKQVIPDGYEETTVEKLRDELGGNLGE